MWRERELNGVTIVQLFLQQALRGNVSCNLVRHLNTSDASFTGSAYRRIRAWPPLPALQALIRKVTAAALGSSAGPDGRAIGFAVGRPAGIRYDSQCEGRQP